VRVLLISHYNPGVFEYGGLATFVRELSRGLRELGHEVHYVAVSPAATRRQRYVRVVPSGFSPEELDYSLPEVVGLCAELDGLYDVIVANDYFSPCVARESRLVAYVHTYAGSPWELLLLSYADRVCTNSRLSKSAFEEHARFVRQLTSPWTGKPLVEVEVLYPPPPEPPGRGGGPGGYRALLRG
jgi:glycosyltransferase involved in cell wall biosynthesis